MTVPDRLPPFPNEGRLPSASRLARAAQVDHLARLPLFANCSKRELRHLAGATRVDQLEVDEVLFREEQPAREAYVIVAGHAVVRRNGRTVAELGPGEFVGELALLLRRDHRATVVAASPLEVLVLPQEGLRLAIDEVPGLGWKLLQTFADRILVNTARGHETP